MSSLAIIFFFFNDTATTEIYTGWYTLSYTTLFRSRRRQCAASTRCFPPDIPPRSEEHTSELQSHHPISYAVFCLKKKKKHNHTPQNIKYHKTSTSNKKINKL